MAEQKIEFRKIRDFGENLSDLFIFIKENGGSLMKSFIAISSIFMLAQAIFSGIYQANTFGFLDAIIKGRSQSVTEMRSVFGFNYFMILFLTLLTITSMQVAIGAYIKHYVQYRETPSIQDVWSIFKRYFPLQCLYNIPVYLSIIIGFFFCFLPGIYLSVVLAPFTLVVMMEDKNLGDAYQRCFELVRENFWMSFCIYLIAYLIYLLGGTIIGLSVSIIGGLLAYLTTSEISTSLGVVTSFLNIFSLIFYVVYFISVALNYFSLVERRDGTGLLNRIDDIGANPSTFKDTEEQY